MTTTIVWLMVIVNTHGSIWSTGPEFTSKDRCEVAAKVLHKSVDELRWGTKTPICVRIEK